MEYSSGKDGVLPRVVQTIWRVRGVGFERAYPGQ